MFPNVLFRCGHRIMEKEDSSREQSQGPPKKMDKGVLTEEQNLGLPGGQIKKLTPQPRIGAFIISAQQDLTIAVYQREFLYLYINKSI